ncbi:nucleoside-binding protein [Trichormus variabilis ATCC 29413]|uniref:Nucleoside-binding protein n=2 Tax=Anabaena variabilis TaxID=264691 RepID=Q3M9X3_TRIV2|nr:MULTISPECIES: BMP family protein [Nostocaceae]ABA22213.1 nucleoside-binding protein [Trichormus variabilis ATCC 29413]MBC1217661.1 BMP family protein [Trichormus variabilis ARAD]MBC1254334.1 BMP family protein [Trichormus variabilis V5]MBC1268044.1 BMP family protein [Trichormus variabilis FSR]MBC1301246.1 BMP family protein [Trichormus variabilis N2B]
MQQDFSRRKFVSYGAATFTTTLLLKACSSNQTSTPTASSGQEKFKIAIALPGAITDQAWNQSGYEGLNLAKQKLNAEVAYVEQVAQTDQTEALTDFARKGYNLIFAHGGQFDAAIEQVAPQFPNTFFVGVNGNTKAENIASLRIDHLQGSYLCGIIGASVTKSNKLAYIAGQEFPATQEELRGFELGAKSVNPKIQVISTFTGDWSDVAKAKEATLALISSGVDVIYQWFDSASPAVLQTASDKGVYAFGNTKDQLDIAPKAVLTSVVKRLDIAIAYLAELAQQKQLKGQIYTIGLEREDILSLGKFGVAVPETIKQNTLKIKQEIVDQTITFVTCQEAGKNTRCIKKA